MPPSLLESPSFADAENLAQVVDRLGGIPLDRIVWKPFPGTATEADQIRYVDGDDKRLVELLDGILVEKAMGSPASFLASTLIILLGSYIRKHRLGVIGAPDMLIDTGLGRIRMPDVCFTHRDRILSAAALQSSISHFMPNLCIEILSDGNTKREMAEKRRDYFAGGCEAVWIVDPETKTIAVYSDPIQCRIYGIADTIDGGEMIPGFTLPVGELFEEQPWNS